MVVVASEVVVVVEVVAEVEAEVEAEAVTVGLLPKKNILLG